MAFVATAVAIGGAIGAGLSAVAVAAAALTIGEIAMGVALAGAALSVAGAVTKNKTLSTIGMAMGIAGGVVGIGAGLLGIGTMTLGEAMTATGEFFAADAAGAAGSAAAEAAAEGATQEAMGQGIVASTSPEYASATPASIHPASQEALGEGIMAGTPVPPADVSAAGAAQQEAGRQAVNATLDNLGASQEMAGITPGAPTPTPTAAPTPTNPEASYNALLQQSNAGPQAPGAPTDTGMSSAQGSKFMSALNAGGTNVTPTPPPASASMPEWAKYAAMTSGVQGLTGLAAGYFQGLNAEERLEFDKLVNQQKYEGQQFMQRNGSYAPRISFNKTPGALNTVRA